MAVKTWPNLLSITGLCLENPTDLIVARNIVDLVGAIIPEYRKMRFGERKAARYDFAVGVATTLQDVFLQAGIKSGDVSFESESSTREISRMLVSKNLPIDDMSSWEPFFVPLVLVHPGGAWVKPEGEVVTIDPSDEHQLLNSLILCGLAEVERIAPGEAKMQEMLGE
jgi:hypothetical protein